MTSPNITWINASDPPDAFPDVGHAFDVPDGLLAAGGDLSESRLLHAYSRGIFPWYSEGQPILWWSPDPRCIIRPSALHVSRSTRRTLRRSDLEIGFNGAFEAVLAGCAAERPGQVGTWITAEMEAAYRGLHRSGWAHSVEVWRHDQLVGGLYGVSIGKVFFGESMFSGESNASKAAMLALCRILSRHDFPLFDCQVRSPHLMSLGAELLPRTDFCATLDEACHPLRKFAKWPAGRLAAAELLA